MGPNFFFKFFQMPKASPNHIFCKNVMTLVPCDLKWNWNGVVRCDVSCKFWFLHVLAFAKRIFFMTHNMPNPQNVVQWSFYSVFSERRFMGHTVILQYLNIQEAASRSTCYYVFRKSSLLRCCKPRHVTKQDLLQFKNSKNWSLLCMGFKIILCLDLSILLWISDVFFAWI